MYIHTFAVDFFDDDLFADLLSKLEFKDYNYIFFHCNQNPLCKKVSIYIFSEHHLWKLYDKDDLELLYRFNEMPIRSFIFGINAKKNYLLYLKYIRDDKDEKNDRIEVINTIREKREGVYNHIDKKELNQNSTFRDTTDLKWLITNKLRVKIMKCINEYKLISLNGVNKKHWLHYLSLKNTFTSNEIYSCIKSEASKKKVKQHLFSCNLFK